MQFDSIARGGFASDHKSRAGHLFLLIGKVKVTQPLYLQMLLAPDRAILV